MYRERVAKLAETDILNSAEKQRQALFDIFFARYTFDVQAPLVAYFEQFSDEASGLTLILALQSLIGDTQLESKSLLFPESTIPQELLENNQFARTILQEKITIWLSQLHGKVTNEMVLSFLVSNHEWIKWSLNIWFLVNSSTMAELIVVDESIEKPTMDWAKSQYGVEYGQPITHPHLISRNGKKRLAEANFPDVSPHLLRDDYVQMLRMCYLLSISTQDSLGFIARSWIYNPKIHDKLDDGKPFVAFNFLEHDYIAGEREFISVADPNGMFPDQYSFATRNERRRTLVESGAFSPDVYAVFHSNQFFKQNIEDGLLELDSKKSSLTTP